MLLNPVLPYAPLLPLLKPPPGVLAEEFGVDGGAYCCCCCWPG